MSYQVEGDYFEACSCRISCACIFLGPATEDTCDLVLAWHLDKGRKDGVDLAGLNVAMAVRSPKQMTDGGWKVALYFDERATTAQADALKGIFSGQAGGHIAGLAPLIGEVVRVAPARITFEKRGGEHRHIVGDVLDGAVSQITGMDGKNPVVITNPLLGAVAQPMRQAKAEHLRYRDAFTFDSAGTNSFINEFRYEA